MTEQRRLAIVLAGVDGDIDRMHRLLRSWGFRGFTLGFTAFLEHLVELGLQFEKLSVSYPGVSLACAQCLRAPALTAAVQSALEARERSTPFVLSRSERLRRQFSDFDVRGPAPEDGAEPTESTSERAFWEIPFPLSAPVMRGTGARLVHAAAFVLKSIWDGYSDGLDGDMREAVDVLKELCRNEQYEDFWRAVDQESGVASDLESTLVALERVTAVDSPYEAHTLPPMMDKGKLTAFVGLLSRTRVGPLGQPWLAADEARLDQIETMQSETIVVGGRKQIFDEEARRWGNRSSLELKDRELLVENSYGLNDTQCRLLASEATVHIDSTVDVRPLSKVLKDAMPLALGLALATGRVPSAAVRMRLCSIPEQLERTADVIELQSKTPGGWRGLRWQTRCFLTTGLALRVPDRKWSFPEQCVDFEVAELFARPVEDIANLVDESVADLLACEVPSMYLFIKHALAREMFSFNANRAAIDFVCGEPGDTGMSAGLNSLHRYIDPLSASVACVYQFAVGRLLNGRRATDAAAIAACTAEKACKIIPAETMRPVVAAIRAAALQLPTGPELELLFAHHNAFALYSAGMMDAGSGPRSSKTAFYFPHDVNVEEQVAFLAEKIAAGREARFVPISSLAQSQIGEYRVHVLWLSEKVRPYLPELADQMLVAIGVLRARDGQQNDTGMFFMMRHGRLRTIGSAAIDWAYGVAARRAGASAQDRLFRVRTRRRNFATYLADRGLSGTKTETQLGHSGDQHPLGHSSCWIPNSVHSEIRDHADEFLRVNGWVVANAVWACDRKRTYKPIVPSFFPGALAYEGRALSADGARDRAREALHGVIDVDQLEEDGEVELDQVAIRKIRALIGQSCRTDEENKAADSVFESILAHAKREERYCISRAFMATRPGASALASGRSVGEHDLIRRAIRSVLPEAVRSGSARVEIDEAALQRIRADVLAKLDGDAEAQRKVLSVFAEVAAAWRRRPGYVVTSASLNLTRFSAGPVGVTAARHLAIACHMQRRAPDAIRDYLEHKGEGASIQLKRLACIAVMLPLTDAVMKLSEIKPLIESAQAGDSAQCDGQVQLRATIETSRSIYDRTVDCTHHLSAAVVGYRRTRGVSEKISHEAILREADDLVKRISGRPSELDLATLVEVMKVYWSLHFPGTVHAVCAGRFECNAPSESNMRLMLGQAPEPAELTHLKRRESAPKLEEINRALCEARDLLNRAKGEIQKKGGSSRSQRQRLRRAFKKELGGTLVELTSSYQIVDLWVTFLMYLLEVGGVKVDTYAFNSIVTYQSRIMQAVLEVGWEIDPLELDSYEFDQFYRAALATLDESLHAAATTVLRRFHEFLRSWYGVGSCDLFPAQRGPRRMARNLLVPLKRAAAAIELIGARARVSGLRAPPSRLIALTLAYGLRTGEGFGGLRRDFPERKCRAFRARANSIRSLKTFGRKVPVALTDEQGDAVLNGLRASARADVSDAKMPLFFDPEDVTGMLPYASTVAEANATLRLSTGEATATVYNLRHTFASSIGFALLLDRPSASPIAKRLAESLKLPLATQNDLRDCRPNSEIYPFQIDRLGMWMGQAGSETLINTYLHLTWSIAGEYCSRHAVKNGWKVAEVAALLGVSRARLAQLKPKGTEMSLGEQLAEIVTKYVDSSDLSKLASATREVDEPRDGEGYESPKDFPLEVADAILVMRRRDQCEKPRLIKECAEEFFISEEITARFFAGYLEVASTTCMVDFEPAEARLGRAANLGVDRGHVRRRQLLAHIDRLALASPAFAAETVDVATQWLEGVKASEPLLVSRSVGALLSHVTWLRRLGYRDDQMIVHIFRGDADEIKKEIGSDVEMLKARGPVGRRAVLGATAEYGLTARAGLKLPSERDLQRVICALACCVKAGLSIPCV